MRYGEIVGRILLNVTSGQQVDSSGFPVAGLVVLIGLILAIVIWDVIKARKEVQWTDERDEEEDRR